MGPAELVARLASLERWLRTWRTGKGAFLSPAIQRGDLKRLFRTNDTAWSQGAVLKGYLNLFLKTHDERWLEEAIRAGTLLVSRIDHKSGRYRYGGFENERMMSLASCSVANAALIALGGVVEDAVGRGRGGPFIQAAQRNVDQYIIAELWNPTVGAFRYSAYDAYSPDLPRYIANGNSVAVEALRLLAERTGIRTYVTDYVGAIGEWLLTQQEWGSEIEHGSIRYASHEAAICPSFYTALSLRGVDDLYVISGRDARYRRMMTAGVEHLLRVYDGETGLFFHGVEKGIVRRFPQYVAGAAIILKAISDTNVALGTTYVALGALEAVLTRQLTSGGVPSFVGYNTPDNCRPYGDGTPVWEDIVPIVGWNAHLFEFLTEYFVPEGSMLSATAPFGRVSVRTGNFTLVEGKRSAWILSRRPSERRGFYLYVKRLPVAFGWDAARVRARLSAILPDRVKHPVKRLLRLVT